MNGSDALRAAATVPQGPSRAHRPNQTGVDETPGEIHGARQLLARLQNRQRVHQPAEKAKEGEKAVGRSSLGGARRGYGGHETLNPNPQPMISYTRIPYLGTLRPNPKP